MIIFEKQFPTEKNTNNGIVNSIITEMNKYSGRLLMPEESLRLILDEAIINAMEHGNRWNREKMITVTIEKASSSLKVIISDEGDGFQFSRDFQQEQPSPMRERGRGIHLIKYLCSAEWQDNGATVNLHIPVECPL